MPHLQQQAGAIQDVVLGAEGRSQPFEAQDIEQQRRIIDVDPHLVLAQHPEAAPDHLPHAVLWLVTFVTEVSLLLLALDHLPHAVLWLVTFVTEVSLLLLALDHLPDSTNMPLIRPYYQLRPHSLLVRPDQ